MTVNKDRYKFSHDWSMYLFEKVGDVSVGTIMEWKDKAEKYDKLIKLTPSQKLIDYSKKIIKIREILEKSQYMDEAVLLKIKILEVLDS